MDIRTLHREGHSIKEIARQTGRSRNTIRRVLREAGPKVFHKPVRSSCLDSFKPYLKDRFESCGLSAVRLLPEVQAMGYNGSISTLRRYLHSLRPEQERQKKLTVRHASRRRSIGDTADDLLTHRDLRCRCMRS
jgi:transposase